MVLAVIITTTDNPYDPRTDFPSWYAWDVQQGNNTCAYLARVMRETDDFPLEYNDRLVEAVIDEIIAIHSGEVYMKLQASAA